jgi:hypothetical protein
MVLSWGDFDAAITTTGTFHALLPDERNRSMCNLAVLAEESGQPWNPLHPDACWACARAVNQLIDAAQPLARRDGHQAARTTARSILVQTLAHDTNVGAL